MKLLMYVETDLVETIIVNYTKVSLPGYLSSLVRGLKKKHAPLLATAGSDPQFFVHYLTRVVTVPSAKPALEPRPAGQESGLVG